MSYKIERYVFLELFDDYRSIDGDIGAEEYIIYYQNNLIFRLYVSPSEGFASISLEDKKFENKIFDVGISCIRKLDCKDNTLLFYKERNTEIPIAEIQVKPFISLSCDL